MPRLNAQDQYILSQSGIGIPNTDLACQDPTHLAHLTMAGLKNHLGLDALSAQACRGEGYGRAAPQSNMNIEAEKGMSASRTILPCAQYSD